MLNRHLETNMVNGGTELQVIIEQESEADTYAAKCTTPLTMTRVLKKVLNFQGKYLRENFGTEKEMELARDSILSGDHFNTRFKALQAMK